LLQEWHIIPENRLFKEDFEKIFFPPISAITLQSRTTTEPEPFSFAPSQVWEGNDGPRSTFVLCVGTPEQIFRVLISTASQETWAPVSDDCIQSDPSDCETRRGVLPFQNQPSSGFQVNKVGYHSLDRDS
jgi:hypothetical protein